MNAPLWIPIIGGLLLLLLKRNAGDLSRDDTIGCFIAAAALTVLVALFARQ